VEHPTGITMTKPKANQQPIVVESAELRPGYSISRIIRGGWQLAGGHGSVDRQRAVDDFEKFLFAGINTYDCADIYTGVEEMIGRFISAVRSKYGHNDASKIKVHTKIVPDLDRLSTYTPRHIEKVIDRSLQRLGVERLDLVQFFWWDLNVGSPIDTLYSLSHLQEKGKIHLLGVTNWDVQQIEPFFDSGLDIVSAQVQYSMLDQRPANQLVSWCAVNNVKLLCYGVLAGGFLTESWFGKTDPGYEFENRSLIKYRLIIDEFGGWDLFQVLMGELKSVADRHSVSISAVATRYVLDQSQVGAVIIGARYAHNLSSTLAVFNLTLGSDDKASIDSILSQRAGPSGPVYGLEGNRTGIHGSIMKYNLSGSLE